MPCGNPRPSWDTVGKSLLPWVVTEDAKGLGWTGSGLCPAPDQNSREMQEIRARHGALTHSGNSWLGHLQQMTGLPRPALSSGREMKSLPLPGSTRTSWHGARGQEEPA